MMTTYESKREVTPKYLRQMLNVPTDHDQLKKDTKQYQEQTKNDDEIKRTSQLTSNPPVCSVLIFRLVCICLLIVRI